MAFDFDIFTSRNRTIRFSAAFLLQVWYLLLNKIANSLKLHCRTLWEREKDYLNRRSQIPEHGWTWQRDRCDWATDPHSAKMKAPIATNNIFGRVALSCILLGWRFPFVTCLSFFVSRKKFTYTYNFPITGFACTFVSLLWMILTRRRF